MACNVHWCYCLLTFFGIKLLFFVIIVPQFRPVMASVVMLCLIILGMWIVLWVAWHVRYELSELSLPRPSPKQMFVVSCIAVSFDPLFLYIPIVDENNKCLGIDKKLRTAALVLRSLTDIPSVLHIIHQIRRVAAMPEVEPSSWTDTVELQKLQGERSLKIRRICVHIAIYFLAVLPISQVMILVIFLRMRDSILYARTPIVAYLVLQYLVRAYHIYQTCMEYRRVWRWIRAAFNFLLYILAAHVLGAFWYFSSIERETTCWQQACKNIAGCRHAYYCSNTRASTNIALLNESCPINPSNTKLFDFGIFLDALQSGNTGPVGFLTKYFYTFWWGIKNLSNFGTNLAPSSYIWESIFAIIICVIGLLLFIYLIGNVQTYIQMETQKTLLTEDESIKTKYQDIDTWMSDNSVPENIKMEIMKRVKDNNILEKHVDVDVDLKFMLSVTPSGLKNSFKEHLCIHALKKVPVLHNMSDVALRMMCAYVKPKIYHKNSYVFRKGKLIDTMIIIVKGTIECRINAGEIEELRTSPSRITEQRTKGDCCGEELLNCQSDLEYYSLISEYDVQCRTKVEALVVTRKSEMKNVIDYWRRRKWDQNFTPSGNLTASEDKIEKILSEMSKQSGTTEKNEVEESLC